jgi:hypothetical protein
MGSHAPLLFGKPHATSPQNHQPTIVYCERTSIAGEPDAAKAIFPRDRSHRSKAKVGKSEEDRGGDTPLLPFAFYLLPAKLASGMR